MKYFFKRTHSLYFLNVPKEELGRKFLPLSYADKNVCITFFLILSEATSPTAKRKKKKNPKKRTKAKQNSSLQREILSSPRAYIVSRLLPCLYRINKTYLFVCLSQYSWEITGNVCPGLIRTSYHCIILVSLINLIFLVN